MTGSHMLLTGVAVGVAVAVAVRVAVDVAVDVSVAVLEGVAVTVGDPLAQITFVLPK
jgi:hypothetical protein